MRAVIEATESASIGVRGSVRVELMRSGLSMLADQRDLEIIEAPPARPGRQQLTLPPFETRPVKPQDARWEELGWPEDYAAIASSAEMESGVLVIYYSTVFPKYAGRLTRYERRSTGMAKSFTRRYEVWLAAHSLIFHQDELNAQAAHQTDTSDTIEEPNAEAEEVRERQERVRMATLAALFASREVEFASTTPAEIA